MVLLNNFELLHEQLQTVEERLFGKISMNQLMMEQQEELLLGIQQQLVGVTELDGTFGWDACCSLTLALIDSLMHHSITPSLNTHHSCKPIVAQHRRSITHYSPPNQSISHSLDHSFTPSLTTHPAAPSLISHVPCRAHLQQHAGVP